MGEGRGWGLGQKCCHCDDHSTTINIIKIEGLFLFFYKKKKRNKEQCWQRTPFRWTLQSTGWPREVVGPNSTESRGTRAFGEPTLMAKARLH